MSDHYYVDVVSLSPRVRKYLAYEVGSFLGTVKDIDATIEELHAKDEAEGLLEQEGGEGLELPKDVDE